MGSTPQKATHKGPFLGVLSTLYLKDIRGFNKTKQQAQSDVHDHIWAVSIQMKSREISSFLGEVSLDFEGLVGFLQEVMGAQGERVWSTIQAAGGA